VSFNRLYEHYTQQLRDTRLLLESSLDFNVGDTYICKDIFAKSNPIKHHFYYVKAGYGPEFFKKVFKKLNRHRGLEVFGFKNLDYPKMEYRFTYLFRISGTKEALDYIEDSFQYKSEFNRVAYTKKEVIVPAGNDEALDDKMECDLKLAQYNLDKETEQQWGDIASEL
jgi:hypothetical protein